MRTSRFAPAAALLAFVAFTPASAAGKTRVSVGSLTVDGLAVRALVCDLDDGGMFAVMAVVGALAKKKKTLDACAPKGGAFRVAWTWAGGKTTTAEVKASSLSKKDACVAKALRKASTGPQGTCEAIVLVGKAKAAQRAADELTKTEPASPPPAAAPVPPRTRTSN
jgi:hypothetical protein